MKILLCHDFYRQPGGERMAFEAHERLLVDHGHEVLRLTRHNREIDDFSLAERLRLPFGAIDSRRTRREVDALVARERPDVAHVHNVFPLLSPSLYRALARHGVPIVQTLHNFRFLCPNALFFTHGEVCERCAKGNTLHAVRLRCYRGDRFASAVYAAAIGGHRRAGTFRHIARFLAFTPFVGDKIVEAGLVPESSVEVVAPFLPHPLPPAPWREREDFILFLGRLSEEKGADLAVAALASLPGARLKIAGDGPARGALERQAAAVEGVELVGFRAGSEKEDLLRRAAILVVPSRCYEGSVPLAVLEALACGLPVVAAGHGSLADLFSPFDAGRLHRPGDAADLARRLAELLSDRPLRQRLSENARRLYEERFTAEAHYRRLLAVYRQVTA
jgi:glycosyltransferase involved in cell wall biosynthesis